MIQKFLHHQSSKIMAQCMMNCLDEAKPYYEAPALLPLYLFFELSFIANKLELLKIASLFVKLSGSQFFYSLDLLLN